MPNNKLVWLFLYYAFARYLPQTKSANRVRSYCCRHIFEHFGKDASVWRNVYFGSGLHISLGDYSNLGENAHVPSNTRIGNFVMMGPNCYILGVNHCYNRVDIPMIYQGLGELKQTIIEDDVWIGREVLFTPGRRVRKGCVIAARTVFCKDFDSYSVVGGCPAKLIKMRTDLETEEVMRI